MLFTSQIGEISFHMLKDNFVDIYNIEEGLSVGELSKDTGQAGLSALPHRHILWKKPNRQDPKTRGINMKIVEFLESINDRKEEKGK